MTESVVENGRFHGSSLNFYDQEHVSDRQKHTSYPSGLVDVTFPSCTYNMKTFSYIKKHHFVKKVRRKFEKKNNKSSTNEWI